MSMAAAGAAVQAVGAIVGGLREGAALDSQADGLDETGRLQLLLGEREVAQTYRDARQVAGEAVAAAAGSGVVTGTGSAADVVRESLFQSELEAMTIRNDARLRDAAYRQQAADTRYQANSARLGGLFEAVSAGLGYEMQRQDRARLETQRNREWESRRPRQRTGMTKPSAGSTKPRPTAKKFGTQGG